MAPKHPVDGLQSECKRRRVVATTEVDVQVKSELDGPIFQEQERTTSNVQSIASQPVLDWFAEYQSCESFFLNHGQASPYVQALCTYMNIRLPYQKIAVFPPTTSNLHIPPSTNNNQQLVLLVTYIRHLICTGHGTDLILKEFFGSGWSNGIGRLREQEELNYLFAAKSASWHEVKLAYGIGSGETVPFLVPLKEVTLKKITDAERSWSEWLALQDWEIGPRRPPSLDA
ncbi:hypothetical protein DL98DRAFT_608354 [Cadophora sp. DSE1049]|nr:hypothetical protein DL98DRAFT_608354 [Cadophora sp. DSE1049]